MRNVAFFYTEIEKILNIIAREWDGSLPVSESWHRDLLVQMSEATAKRPPVLCGRFHDASELIEKALDALEQNAPPPPQTAERPLQTAADIVLSHMRNVPPDVMAAMPTDGASQHDHYIYGVPKRAE